MMVRKLERLMVDRQFLIRRRYCLLLFIAALLWGSRSAEAGTAGNQAATPPSSALHTWFIRADGGDRKQCTGDVDAGYRGKGRGQPCAFKHPYYLFTTDAYNDKRWIVGGGDTVVVRGGPYRLGYRGPGSGDGWGSCPGDPYGCSMPPVPSGTPDHPTRLLGENHGRCDKKTQLFGGYALSVLVNLKGSKNVDMECLELTDHGQCTRIGAGYPVSEGCSSSFPLSDYAQVGIVTDHATANILLKDLDIHGLTSRGIIGAIGGEVKADHVRIGFNGEAGWDFDDGKGTPSAPGAAVEAAFLTVEWSGCNEEYPIQHAVPAFSCFDQDHGGYGDGIGTPATQLNFSCDHCTFRYNTQDGFDLVHVSGSLVSIKNSTAYGNMGQQWKIGAMHNVIFHNNVTVNNCRRLSADMPGAPERYRRYLSLFCRAGGDGIAFSVADGGTYLFQNNSFAGYGATSYGMSGAGRFTRAKITFQNNLTIGFKDPVTGLLPGVFYMTELSWFALARDHNLYYNMRTCPGGMTEHCVDPKIARLPAWSGEPSLDTIDFHLTAGSPARGAGVKLSAIPRDHEDAERLQGSSYDVGAFQYRR